MIVKLLTERHLEFLSIKGGCIGSSESTHVKMPHCWKTHALAQLLLLLVDVNTETGYCCTYLVPRAYCSLSKPLTNS